MAEVTIINAQVGVVVLDASVSEAHSMPVEITRHAVEEGADMSDHIRELPEQLTIKGVITNHPLRFTSDNKPKSPLASDTGQVEDRNETGLAQLREYKSNGAIIDVATSLRPYSNMAIAGIVVNRDVKSGNILDMTIDLEEIPIAVTETVNLPKPKKKANKKPKNSGKTGKDKTTEKQKSAMKNLADKALKDLGLAG